MKTRAAGRTGLGTISSSAVAESRSGAGKVAKETPAALSAETDGCRPVTEFLGLLAGWEGRPSCPVGMAASKSGAEGVMVTMR